MGRETGLEWLVTEDLRDAMTLKFFSESTFAYSCVIFVIEKKIRRKKVVFGLLFFFVFFTDLYSSSNMLIAMWFFKMQVRVTAEVN